MAERTDTSQRPPARRDPRADPDDDDDAGSAASSSSRVDVVRMDREREPSRASSVPEASLDSLTNAALTLRRELAKLHQQAAAVERTIEDQRRERSDALERMEQASAQVINLQERLEQAEAELSSVRGLHETALASIEQLRGERDELERVAKAGKKAEEEVAHAKEEIERLRQAHEETKRDAAKHEAELAEIRKREQAEAAKVSDTEAQATALRERVERLTAELSQAHEETAQTKTELQRARQDITAANDTATQLRADLEHEKRTSKDQIERLEKSLSEARAFEAQLTSAQADLSSMRVDLGQARSDVQRLERDLEAARHARDVNLERASMAEREASNLAKDVERLQRDLEVAANAAARAETRAALAERQRTLTEESVRQLRDEVTSAFARWRTSSPSVPPPTVVASAEQVAAGLAVPGHHPSEAPPTRRGGANTSFPPLMAEARPLGSGPPPLPKSHSMEPVDDDAWGTPSGAPAPAIVIPPIPTPPNVPRSHPPPPPPPPQRASVPAPPPAAMVSGPPAPPDPRSIPPAFYPSMPPPVPVAVQAPSRPPPYSQRPSADDLSGVVVLSKERDELFERLLDPDDATAAALVLRSHPEWLRGRPPIQLLEALTELDYDVEAPVFEVARLWEREPLCRALIASLRDEPDPKMREHSAWLLKHLSTPSKLTALTEMVCDETEPATVRRWLLEAIERLVASRAIGWKDVGELVSRLVRHADPSLRDGVIGVVAALERSDEKRRLLLELLRTDDDEIVLASAVHALASALPIELDPTIVQRLLGHPSARVQRSVVDFIERSKRAARNA